MKMNNICGIKVKFIKTLSIPKSLYNESDEYDIYEIDISQYKQPFIVYEGTLIRVKDHIIIYIPEDKFAPNALDVEKLGYSNFSYARYRSGKTTMRFSPYSNDTSNQVEAGAYHIYHAYTRIEYTEIIEEKKPGMFYPTIKFVEKHIGLIDTYLWVFHFTPASNIYYPYPSKKNDNKYSFKFPYPYYDEFGEIHSTEIPMLKHGYTNVYVISSLGKYEITLNKHNTIMYDTIVYGNIKFGNFDTLNDAISFLSKHMDHRKWIGFEDIKFSI